MSISVFDNNDTSRLDKYNYARTTTGYCLQQNQKYYVYQGANLWTYLEILGICLYAHRHLNERIHTIFGAHFNGS